LDEVIEEFLIESREAVDQLDRDLVLLEASPDQKDVVSRVFRALHTIKGSCGFLDFKNLERVAHLGEGLLAKIRDGKATVTTEVASALLATIDAIREMLELITATERDGEQTYSELVAELKRLTDGEPLPILPHVTSVLIAEATTTIVEKKPRAGRKRKPQPQPQTALLSLRPVPPPALPVVAPPEPPPLEASPRGPEAAAPSAQAETVRVDVELLDRLMDLAGELVLTRNQVRAIQQGLESRQLASASQRLNLVTAGLQEGIMRMRMQSVEHIFGKFPRLVRDTAKQCGKMATVVLEGKDAELDRSLLEAIKDPLTHLIRNAVDHGIEMPERRLERGKPAEGKVRVRAVHEGGHVSIEIADDGAGIPLDRVRQKAVAAGLIDAERAQRMSDAEATSLIFLPGLSTASSVTSVSGRGVGMDVVKTNVEKLGGTVEVETRLGAGTTFRLKLPLTLAIIPALIVEAAGERYAIPQGHLLELVLVDRRKQGLESVYDAPVFRLRERLLPVVFLGETLGLVTRQECLAKEKHHMAVLQINGLCYGLVVDRVIDQQEVVVKPLASQLEQVVAYSACTVLGDGRVVLILDAAGLAQRASVRRNPELEPESAVEHASAPTGKLESYLLLSERDVRVALPLDRVLRLETVALARLEHSGAREVVQHENEVLPLVRLKDLLLHAGAEDPPPSRYVNVVVLATGDGRIGIVVHDVIDVVELPTPERSIAGDDLVLATVVVQERVTDVWNIDTLLARSGIRVETCLLRSA
jgi:two-component system, chemotaxis family, sensor kinase CheA